MKHFKTEADGEFACTLVRNTLSLHGIREHIHIKVPGELRAKAGCLMRRDSGEDLLAFAETCITREVEASV